MCSERGPVFRCVVAGFWPTFFSRRPHLWFQSRNTDVSAFFVQLFCAFCLNTSKAAMLFLRRKTALLFLCTGLFVVTDRTRQKRGKYPGFSGRFSLLCSCLLLQTPIARSSSSHHVPPVQSPEPTTFTFHVSSGTITSR